MAEVEIEGDHEGLHDEALRILGSMADMVPSQPEGVAPTVALAAPSADEQVLEVSEYSSPDYDISVDTLALRRDCSSAADLAEAACIYLHFVEGKSTFSRAEILEAMKGATSLYKEAMTGNLTKTLRSLIKGEKLLSRGSGQYALSSSVRTTAEEFLAKIG